MSNKVKITVKDYGEMIVELYEDKAPKTVQNFVKLVKDGFYTDLIFHRVISGFMIQGGGFDKDFSHKQADSIMGEFAANGFKQNDLSHTRGTISMARTQEPNSASSQFFIMHQDSDFLNKQYAAFGRVVEGIEVVDKIAAVETGNFGYHGDVPKDSVIIEKIEML